MWKEILEEIQQFSQQFYKNEGVEVWFRGQRVEAWFLQSTLHRYIKESYQDLGISFSGPEAIASLWDQYKTLYRQYKEKSWNLLEPQERNGWGIIFSMRNHGIPTILLDWTKSFVTALYFANYERNPGDDAAIFIMHPLKLNKQSIGQEHLISLEEGFHDDAVVDLNSYHPHYKKNLQKKLSALAVTPVFTNQRMAVQNSNYILCGDGFIPLEAQYSECIKKIVLPASTFEDSMNYLNLNSINHFMLFPDLFGLSVELNKGLKEQIELVKNKMSSNK